MAGQRSIQYPHPKPRKLSILSTYEKTVLSAFKTDCESFLEHFEKAKTLNYADFATIWQKNCFTSIFAGMVKIRLTLEEYKEIKLLMDEMVKKEQRDFVYIFAKMKSDSAFIYVKEPKPLIIELTKSVKSMFHLDDTFQNRGSESSLNKFRDILEDETAQALQKTSSEYDSLLKKYAVKHPSIQFKSTVIDDLKKAQSKVFGHVSTESNIKDRSEDDTSIIETRQSIRLKAMRIQNAEYRGSKSIITAMDLEEGEDDSDDEEWEDVKTTKRKGRPKGKKKRTPRKSLIKKGSKSKDDAESD